MEFLISPTAAYLLIVTTFMMLLGIIYFPQSTFLKVAFILCLAAAGFELFNLAWAPWALLVVAFSPVPFFLAIRKDVLHLPFSLLTLVLLNVGAAFLFVDKNGDPTVNYVLAGGVAIVCGETILIALGRRQNREGRKLSEDRNSVVGITGVCKTEIEQTSTGMVEVEGELWLARSKSNIPAGSAVRILRKDGAVLTVKQIDKNSKI